MYIRDCDYNEEIINELKSQLNYEKDDHEEGDDGEKNGKHVIYIKDCGILSLSFLKSYFLEEKSVNFDKITHLDFSNNKLSSENSPMKSIENTWSVLFELKDIFKNLTHLSLKNNAISYVDKYIFTHFPKLKYLDVSFNKIYESSSHDWYFLTESKLSFLSLRDNNLGDEQCSKILMYLADNKYIKQLDLSSNLITLKKSNVAKDFVLFFELNKSIKTIHLDENYMGMNAKNKVFYYEKYSDTQESRISRTEEFEKFVFLTENEGDIKTLYDVFDSIGKCNSLTKLCMRYNEFNPKEISHFASVLPETNIKYLDISMNGEHMKIKEDKTCKVNVLKIMLSCLISLNISGIKRMASAESKLHKKILGKDIEESSIKNENLMYDREIYPLPKSSLSNTPTINYIHLEQYLEEILKSPSDYTFTIKKLDISFSYFTDKCMTLFTEVLKKLQNLETLVLDFCYFGKDNDLYKNVGDEKKYPILPDYGDGTNCICLSFFIESILVNTKNIKKLSMKGARVRYEDIKHIDKIIEKNIQKDRNIKIDFTFCKAIGNDPRIVKKEDVLQRFKDILKIKKNINESHELILDICDVPKDIKGMKYFFGGEVCYNMNEIAKFFQSSSTIRLTRLFQKMLYTHKKPYVFSHYDMKKIIDYVKYNCDVNIHIKLLSMPWSREFLTIEKLCETDKYMNIFETRFGGGYINLGERRKYEKRSFGNIYDHADLYINDDVAKSKYIRFDSEENTKYDIDICRPKYGCLNILSLSASDQQSKNYGMQYFTLHRNAKDYCTISSKDSVYWFKEIGTLDYPETVFLDMFYRTKKVVKLDNSGNIIKVNMNGKDVNVFEDEKPAAGIERNLRLLWFIYGIACENSIPEEKRYLGLLPGYMEVSIHEDVHFNYDVQSLTVDEQTLRKKHVMDMLKNFSRKNGISIKPISNEMCTPSYDNF